jgi:hypothetical protein
LGWATITHPFHPLRGQRFAVLKSRLISGIESLSLRGTTGGTFAVPRNWTDLAHPSPYAGLELAPLVFDFECLVAVAELLGEIERFARKGLHE